MLDRQLIAILRGIEPPQALEAAHVLIEAGFNKIEVPLNSPSALHSIQLMVDHFSNQAAFGAGTVLNVKEVEEVAHTGATMIISPNCNIDVIKRTKQLKMLSYPGILTPTEAFSAIDAGADGLKIFPASIIGTSGVAAMAAVIPKTSPLYAVGGANADNFKQWIESGVSGFGIGSALFKPGYSTQKIAEIARQMVNAYDKATR